MKRIITASGNKYIDQELFDYLKNIQYVKTIPNDSKIFFAKNCTIPRLITDFMDTGIKRVIKQESADYCIIDYIVLDNYPRQYDPITNSIVSSVLDSDLEVVYAISSQSSEIIFAIDQVLKFIELGNTIQYVHQGDLNKSVNNGLIINLENYDSMLELIGSNSSDNRTMVATMISNSDIEKNIDWILYLYHGKAIPAAINNNTTLTSVCTNLGFYMKYGTNNAFDSNNFDNIFTRITNPEVEEMFIQLKRKELNNKIGSWLEHHLHTTELKVTDFTLELKKQDEIN